MKLTTLVLLIAFVAALGIPSMAEVYWSEPAYTAAGTLADHNFLREPPLFPSLHDRISCEDSGGWWYCAPGMPPSPACCWY